MPLFQPYSKARREDVPDYVKAEIEDARNRAAAKMSENAIRSQNLLGGGMLYNAGMKAAGKSPISDFIGGVFDKPAYDPTIEGLPDVADFSDPSAMGGPEVVESTGAVTPYGAETGMVADPLTTSMEANAGIDPSFDVRPMSGTDATMGVEGTLPDGVTAVDASISGVPPVDPLTSATTATETANVANAANAASTAATGAETAAALESAMAANAAAAGAGGAAGAAGSAGAGAAAGAGGGAMSGALAALGPLGAIAALAALFG